MRPDWYDAREWAKYLAQDGHGSWWWYLAEPVWSDERGRWIHGERVAPASYNEKNPSQSLERRP